MSVQLVRSAVVAIVVGQLAAGHSGVLGGALVAAYAAHGHGHAVSLLAHAGHVDVVLHHDGELAERGEPPTGFEAHHADHVVHAAASGAVRDGSRRAPSLVTLVFPAPLPHPGSHTESARSVRGGSLAASPFLRTSVLRI